MTSGVHVVQKQLRAGTAWYVYAWRGGPMVHKFTGAKRPKLTPEVMGKIAAAWEAKTEKNDQTLRGLIRQWRSQNPDRPSSPEWTALAASTKRTWGSALDMIDTKWGDVPLAVFNDARMKAKVYTWRDSRRHTPRAADFGVTVLRALLKFGVQRGALSINVAADIPSIYKNGQRADIIWLADDLALFARVASPAVNDAVRLACLTGLRCADLADLRWHEVGDKAIIHLAQKSSKGVRRRAMVAMTPALATLLQELRNRPRKPDIDTVLVTGDGKPWSSAGLSKQVGEASKKAGIIHEDGRKKHLHDCRGTFATHLMMMGATDQEIARAMAWSPEKVANIRMVYVDQARTVVALADRLAAKAVN